MRMRRPTRARCMISIRAPIFIFITCQNLLAAAVHSIPRGQGVATSGGTKYVNVFNSDELIVILIFKGTC